MMPEKPETRVNENSSCRLTFTLQDFDGTAVPSTNITTATMTLKNQDDGATINNREDVDVSSYFDTSGDFSMILSGADNPIVASSNVIETHVATFTIDATAGSDSFDLVEEIWIQVNNLKQTS